METIVFACFLVILTTTSLAKAKYYSNSHTIDVPTTIKETHLHFYLHDTISGDNPTAVLVAKPNNTVVQEGNPIPFGAVYVFDDPLT
ncbi:putative dirigent protein [Helianthus annuus]|uniref:Dirigent protein n=1 Tax=Helianthus annuus TaxID=4232 RepID=A0A9K3H4E0_HELAN|nr:putative dirigent protein [Helianthus annuus]KAJ0451096.1 putative dirigent protein [Helianthus annuus]KAJ0455491.1 putative dirigent protein [Helianthus annuus]KAJ0472956.1 putative dirigent protein [Helianthus annuus]KAJ0648561.1 putative dirigent protein [Helianthus annuus]